MESTERYRQTDGSSREMGDPTSTWKNTQTQKIEIGGGGGTLTHSIQMSPEVGLGSTTLPVTLSSRIFSFDLVQKLMTRLNIHYVFATFGSVG